MGDLSSIINQLVQCLESMSDIEERVTAVNKIREAIHRVSPMRDQPVDYIQWVKLGEITANDYNPNVVAPPEMRLLQHSIDCDGYTQPIVVYPQEDCYEVVDGFHRHLIGKNKGMRERLHGYLPIVAIRADRTNRDDRIASTIRHNRARGTHKVDNMSEIVVELSRRNWSDKKIARELGMDPDEVLRLKQISGLAEIFQDDDFSEAWEIV